MTKKQLSYNIQYALMQGLYWLGFCACVAFAAVYMQHRGYTNSEIGLTIALGNIIGVALSAWLGSLADRKGRTGLFAALMALVAGQLIIQGTFTFIKDSSGFVAVGYCLYLAFVNAGGGLVNQLSFELQAECGRVNFGTARALGSLFYSLGATVIGALLEAYTPAALPLAAGTGMLCQLVLLFALSMELGRGAVSADAHANPGKDGGEASSLIDFFRNNRRYTLMMFGMGILFISQNLVITFFINVVRAAGGDMADMGRITGFMAIMELPTMLLFDRISRRISAPACMRIASVGLVLKALAFALATSVSGLYAACLLQAVSFGLITPASVRYSDLYIPPKDAAKGQTVAFAMTTLGSVFAGSVGGILFDNLPVRTALLVGTAVAVAGAVVCIGFSKPEREINDKNA